MVENEPLLKYIHHISVPQAESVINGKKRRQHLDVLTIIIIIFIRRLESLCKSDSAKVRLRLGNTAATFSLNSSLVPGALFNCHLELALDSSKLGLTKSALHYIASYLLIYCCHKKKSFEWVIKIFWFCLLLIQSINSIPELQLFKDRFPLGSQSQQYSSSQVYLQSWSWKFIYPFSDICRILRLLWGPSAHKVPGLWAGLCSVWSRHPFHHIISEREVLQPNTGANYWNKLS